MKKKYFVRLATTVVLSSLLVDSVPSIAIAEQVEESSSVSQELPTTSSSFENLQTKNTLEVDENETTQESSTVSSEATQESQEPAETTSSSQEQTKAPMAATNIDSWMPDKALQQAISDRLGIIVADLKQEDLVNLKTLNAGYKGINSLEGIQYATNLIELIIGGNNVVDITPLTGLTKLEDLNISSNKVKDISVISTLPKLKIISAASNQITVLPDLSNCSNLVGMVLSRNYISDISPVMTLGHAASFNFDNQLLGNSGTFVVGFDQLPVSVPLPVTGLDGNKLGPSGGYDKEAIEFTNTDMILKKEGTFVVDFNPSNIPEHPGAYPLYNISGNIVLTYVVKQTYNNVKVQYLDENNNPVHEPKNIPGFDGDAFDATTSEYKLDIPDYYIDETRLPTNAVGTIDKDTPQTITYYYKKNQSAINVHDSTIYVGDSWNAKDNFDELLDKAGVATNYADFIAKGGVVTGSVNTSKSGIYKVDYEVDGLKATATITVKDRQTAVNVHDSTIYVGDAWTAEDNFDSALDKDGKSVAFDKIIVDDSKMNNKKAGIYTVTYTNDGVTATATITVKDRLTAVNVHDSTIYVGDAWIAEDNFDSALDKNGKSLTFDQLTIDDSKMNNQKAGVYQVLYTYDGVTATATITVKPRLTAVNVHDSTIYVNDPWQAKDNFDSALDKDGNSVSFDKLTVDASKMNNTTPGVYEVNYTNDGVTATAKITVKAKQTGVNVHDSTIYVGDAWTAEDNFDSAMDIDGNPVAFDKITVDDSKMNNKKAGTYEVTYTNDGIKAIATITVKERKTAINVHDSTIYVNDPWDAKDNFDSALDKAGNSVSFKEITVDDSQMNNKKAGVYEVVYTNDGVTAIAKITVKDRKTAINVHDSTIYVGDTWTAKDNFDTALDKAGNPVTFDKITVDDSKMDNQKAGIYEVIYTNDGVSAIAKITVKAKQTAVTVHDSTIYVEDAWTAEDNFDGAVDIDGNIVDFDKITVDDSKMDNKKAGVYEVTYTNDGVTATAKITVKDRMTAVNVHDSTIYVGDTWTAEDNFDSALDKSGSLVSFDKITVDDSKMDNMKPGIYEVTYTNDGLTAVAKITVKEKQTGVNVHDSTIYVGDAWTAEDNFDSAVDIDGNIVDFDKITVDDSKMDNKKAGVYEVTYTNEDVTATAKITVKDRMTAVNVHDSTIYVGDAWTAEDNFDSAVDKDGNEVSFDQLTVDDSKMDNTKVGVYEVTYSYDASAESAAVTVKNRLSVNDEGTVSISYLDTDNKEISKSEQLTGKIGETYETKAKTIENYELIETPKNEKGKFEKENIQVTYKYKKTAKNVLLDKTTSGNGTNFRNSGTTSYGSSQRKKSLPKTNDSVNPFLNLAGMMLLLASLTLGYRKKKKDQSNHI
ncbi:bacterial Ig-like domain-containing protein [Enterococcus sp. DIV0187]|uniref:bacterial Ig-like domain-containing protein n=1 Tax=Enterococcus sp. DIV0187 TaxID=2774644 RepID=UPI003F1E6B33